jgi:CheY-like chemotaxis protein
MAVAERRLLVIDDDKMIHTVLRVALGKHGYKVHSAFDSVQALMTARQVKPDLIVLDITMPGGGGYEAFRRLQMVSTTSEIPVLVYSSLSPDEVAQKIPASPSVSHLPKPSPPEQILTAIRKLLGEA